MISSQETSEYRSVNPKQFYVEQSRAPIPQERVVINSPAPPSRTPPSNIQEAILVEDIQGVHLLDAYVVHIFLGLFGVVHFRMGRYWLGLIYLLTGGAFGWGWLVDFVRMPMLVKEYNSKKGKIQGNESFDLLCWDLYALSMTGFVGITHFYLRRFKWGLLYLLTGGLAGIGVIADPFRARILVEECIHPASETRKKNVFSLSDAYILCLSPFGLLGAHHFYLGNYNKGFLYLFTAGFFGIGWISDFFRLPQLVKQENEKGLLASDLSRYAEFAERV